MTTPDALEGQHTIVTAVARYDDLRLRDVLTDDELSGSAPLGREEALELLALSEVIRRKAGYGRQHMVRSARTTGASWAQIGAALGTTKQAAWEAHTRWIDEQAGQHARTGIEGLTPAEAAGARMLAGEPDSGAA